MHSKSERAYRLIKQRIEQGEYLPGHRLVLSQLAQLLDMSVVPVREAIRRLEAEGIVTFSRNVGAQVARIDETEYLFTMQALAIVEGAATALAAHALTAVQLTEARAINERIAKMLDHFDPQQYAALNHEFHKKLYGMCPNPHVRELVDRGWARLRIVRDPSLTFTVQRAIDSVAEHEHIISLIERGAAEAEVEAAVRAHRTATRDAAVAQL